MATENEWVEETWHEGNNEVVDDDMEYYDDDDGDEFYEEEEYYEEYEEEEEEEVDEPGSSAFLSEDFDFDFDEFMKEEEKNAEVEMEPFELDLPPGEEVSSLEDASESSFIVEEMFVAESGGGPQKTTTADDKNESETTATPAPASTTEHKFQESMDWDDEEFEELSTGSFDYDEVVEAISDDDDAAYTEEEVLTDDDDDMDLTPAESADESIVLVSEKPTEVTDDEDEGSDEEDEEDDDESVEEDAAKISNTVSEMSSDDDNDLGMDTDDGDDDEEDDEEEDEEDDNEEDGSGDADTADVDKPKEEDEGRDADDLPTESQTEPTTATMDEAEKKSNKKEKASTKESKKSKKSKKKKKGSSKAGEDVIVSDDDANMEDGEETEDKTPPAAAEKEAKKSKSKSKSKDKTDAVTASESKSSKKDKKDKKSSSKSKDKSDAPSKSSSSKEKSKKEEKKKSKKKDKSSKSSTKHDGKNDTDDDGPADDPVNTTIESATMSDDEVDTPQDNTTMQDAIPSDVDVKEDDAKEESKPLSSHPMEEAAASTSPDKDDALSKEEQNTTAPTAEKTPVEEEDEELMDRPTGFFWGRKQDMKGLDSALKMIDAPGAENVKRVAWVYGNAGIGKTAMVREFLHNNDEKNLTCYGCFEEKMDATKPFNAIVDCLASLVRQLRNDVTAADWKETIKEALGGEVTLLASLIPNVASFLDVDTPTKLTEFDMTTRRLYDRMRFAVRRFVWVVCQQRRVIFALDDMQWSSLDSLKMVETILSINGLRNFFFIGAHRGIKKTHGLQRIKAGVRPICAADIMLEYMGKKDTKLLVTGFLNILTPMETTDEGIEKLAKLIYSKCEGNPLSTVEAILFLCRKGLLVPSENRWVWDKEELLNEPVMSSSAMDIATARLKLLDPKNLLVLKAAGILGLRTFRIDPVCQAVKACFRSEKKTKADSCPVNTAEEVESILSVLTSEYMIERASTSTYQFTHDTIRKAAVSLLPSGKHKLQLLHLNVASSLTTLRVTNSYENKPLEKEELKYLLVEHYGAALQRLRSEKEKEMFAKLSLELAEAAMTKSAFLSATRKLQTGLSVLNESTRWKENYPLTLKINLTLARLKFCTGALGEALTYSNEVTTNGLSDKDKLDAYELIILLFQARGDLEGAFNSTVSVLKNVFDAILDEPAEEAVARVRGLLEGRPNHELQNLPTMTHKKAASKMRFLFLLVEISQLRRDFAHQDIAALRMVEFTLLYGASPFTALSFSLYGLCLVRRGLFVEAHRFGLLAEAMSVMTNQKDCLAVGYHHWAIQYWCKPVRSSLPALAKVSKCSLTGNDMEHVSLFVGAYYSNVLVSGAPMNIGDAMFQSFQTHRAAFGARDGWLATLPFQTVLKLRGRYDGQIDLSGLSGVANDSNAQTRGLQYALFFRMVAAVFFQDCSNALKLKEKLFLRPLGILLPYQAFIEGLISTYHIRVTTSNKDKISYQRKVTKIIDVLRSWGRKGLREVAHMTQILNTELHVAIKKDLTPERISQIYDTAQAAASRQGFFHHQALASERAGLHFLSLEQPVFAQKYISQAYELYKRWGAHGKVGDLESKYPEYIVAPPEVETDNPAMGQPNSPPQRAPGRGFPGRGPPVRGRGRMPGRRPGGRGRAPGRQLGQRGRGPPRGGPGRPPNQPPPNRMPGRGRVRAPGPGRGPGPPGPGRGPGRPIGRGQPPPPRGGGRGRGGPGRPLQPPPPNHPPPPRPVAGRGRGPGGPPPPTSPPKPASVSSLSEAQTGSLSEAQSEESTASGEPASDEVKKSKKGLMKKFTFGKKKKGSKDATTEGEE